jgi:CBS domain containing-hemolysin-like protein
MALFARMAGKRAYISLVMDEFGTMQGIVTLEDLVETLVGFEIVDEPDKNVDMQAVARKLTLGRSRQTDRDSPRHLGRCLTCPIRAG